MPSLVKNRRNSQSQTCEYAERDRAIPTSQLSEFRAKPTNEHVKADRTSQGPLLTLYATPSTCKQSDGRRWWNIRCQFNHKMFGGLYSLAERNRVLEIFDGTASQITPQEFEMVAERVMAETTQRQGAAS